jgi:hypothetical protein
LTAQSAQHSPGLLRVSGLADDLSFDDHCGVRAERQLIAPDDRARFLTRQSRDVIARRFIRPNRFVDVCGANCEINSSRAQQFRAARR